MEFWDFYGPTPPVPANATEITNNYYMRVFHTLALYSQIQANLSDQVVASLGVRYNWDNGRFTNIAHQPMTSFGPARQVRQACFPNPRGILCGRLYAGGDLVPAELQSGHCSGSNSQAWREPSFTFSLQDNLSDSTNVYATTRHGFQGGGFNNAIREQNLQTFKPEVATDFEFGVKSEWSLFGRRCVRIWTGSTVPCNINRKWRNGSYADQTQWIAVFNAGSLTYYGLDFEGKIFVTDNIQIGAEWTHMKASYDNFKFPAVGTLPAQDLSGNTPAQVPLDTLSVSADASLPIIPSAFGAVSLAATGYYRSKITFHDVINLGDFAANSDTAPGFVTLNMTLSWNKIMGSRSMPGCGSKMPRIVTRSYTRVPRRGLAMPT